MDHPNRIAKEAIATLDRVASDLAYIGFYTLADRLEEFTGDLEEKMLAEGMMVGDGNE